MSTPTRQRQLQLDATDRYARILVPTIFGPFARALVEAVALGPGTTVLDVGCGTGAATRFAAQQVGTDGRVIGIDIDPCMIRVARTTPSLRGTAIEWRRASAYRLPVPDGSIDVVLCAQVLQFLSDRPRALSEMYRVLKPSGRVAISVWSKPQDNPLSHNLVQTIHKHLGQDTARGISDGYAQAHHGEIETLLSDTGFTSIDIRARQLALRLPAVERLVLGYISATPIAAAYNSAPRSVQGAILCEMAERLAAFQSDEGLLIPFSANLAFGSKK